MSTDRGVGKLSGALTFAISLFLASHANSQTLREDTSLLDVPDGKSVVLTAKSGTTVKPSKRQGFWIQVEASGKTGWVKASAVNFSSGAGGPTAIDTGRMGQGNIVATSVTRGLSAKDLLNGTPRPAEVAKLASLVADASAVQGFVSQGGVQAPNQTVALKENAAQARPSSDAGRPVTAREPGTGSQPSKGGASKKNDDEW